MQRFKHSIERSSHDVPTTQPSGVPNPRTLSHRRYLELGRRPRLSDRPARRFPYIETGVTVAALLFLLYLVLGGL